MARKRKAKRTKKETIIHLDQRLPEVMGRDPYSIPVKHLLPDKKGGYIEKDERRPSKTLLVNQIREDVDRWRKNGYERPRGISDTSRRLLEWWFDETHFFPDGEPFKYYFAQREAIETVIFLYEVVKKQEAADLIFKYMDPKAYRDDLFTTRKKIEDTTRQRRILTRIVPETGLIAHQEIPAPDHYRYAIKMATGSGKTLVMAMAVVWSYFHKKFEPDSKLSKSFLIIAPNVIVFERLKEDFESGKIFKEWDLIPNEWKHDWQMTYILRGESRKSSTEGTLYLTNIHQLYEPRNNDNYDDPVNRLLGPIPKEATGSWEEDLLDRIKAHDDLLIINDEAHHVHDEDLEWMQVIVVEIDEATFGGRGSIVFKVARHEIAQKQDGRWLERSFREAGEDISGLEEEIRSERHDERTYTGSTETQKESGVFVVPYSDDLYAELERIRDAIDILRIRIFHLLDSDNLLERLRAMPILKALPQGEDSQGEQNE